ncbi:peptidoglycan-binding domain-containing protein [Candidatus Nitrospira salsa]
MVRTWFTTVLLSFTLITPALAEQSHQKHDDSLDNQNAIQAESSDSSLKAAEKSEQSQNSPPPTLSRKAQRGQLELDSLKGKPKEYKVLVMGVQIFLGRFGYGTGPYTGKFDEQTKSALKKYQTHTGLLVTGELDYQTLTHLTDDNKVLDRPLPYLPKYVFHGDQWDKAIEVEGTWASEAGPTSDAVQTTKLYCFRKQKQCIESTAVLLVEHAPMLEVATHVYAIKEWDDEQLVSEPYDGEACTISILRMHRRSNTVTRFSAYQEGKGICANVETEDVQYRLIDGPDVFVNLQQRKAQEIQKILQVVE